MLLKLLGYGDSHPALMAVFQSLCVGFRAPSPRASQLLESYASMSNRSLRDQENHTGKASLTCLLWLISQNLVYLHHLGLRQISKAHSLCSHIRASRLRGASSIRRCLLRRA